MVALFEHPRIYVGNTEYSPAAGSAVFPFEGLDEHRAVRLRWRQLGKDTGDEGRLIGVRHDGVVFATMPIPLAGIGSTAVLVVELLEGASNGDSAIWQGTYRVRREPLRLEAVE